MTINEMNVNEMQAYIEEHFTLDGTSRQLVRNILTYVAVQGDDDESLLAMLGWLLDGIGITEEELAEIAFGKREEET